MNGETIRDLQINDSGELGYDSSSIRGKTAVKDMEDTTWLYSLRPVNYESKARNEKGEYIEKGLGYKRYGLIAEEVEKINPSFVFYDTFPDGSMQVMGVHYNKLITPVIAEVQKHEARIKELESSVRTHWIMIISLFVLQIIAAIKFSIRKSGE